MTVKRLLASVAFCCTVAFTCQAQTPMTTTLDWQFNGDALPSDPSDSPFTLFPPNSSPSLNISSLPNQSGFWEWNDFPGLGFGTQRGSWKMAFSSMNLTINAGIVEVGQPLEYTFKIIQFAGDAFVWPALLQFDVGSEPTSYSRTSVQSAGANGEWVLDTYTFRVNPEIGPLSVTISPFQNEALGNGAMWIDRIEWDIVGTIAVPEPSAQALVALGLAAFGLRGMLRRKS